MKDAATEAARDIDLAAPEGGPLDEDDDDRVGVVVPQAALDHDQMVDRATENVNEIPENVNEILKREIGSHDIDVVYGALVKLAHLCCDDSAGIYARKVTVDVCIHLSAQLHILNTLRRFPDDADAQDYGCSCLMNLCFDNEEASRAVMVAGGTEVILTALADHPEDRLVQITACGALKNLLDSIGQKSDLVHQIHQLGGIPLIVASMEKYPGDPKLLVSACALIEHICVVGGTLRALLDAGVLSSLAREIENHADKESVCKNYAKGALKAVLDTV